LSSLRIQASQLTGRFLFCLEGSRAASWLEFAIALEHNNSHEFA
jgi:hypothetical protein